VGVEQAERTKNALFYEVGSLIDDGIDCVLDGKGREES